MMPTTKNLHRISATLALANAGIEDVDELDDAVVPACCDESCEVEPDGRCEHGCPSVLLALGLI
jgi:hypothetical protein